MRNLICFAALVGSVSTVNADVSLTKAAVEPEHINKAVAIAAELNQREGVPLPAGTPWFEIKKGSVPVLVTAPHSTRQLREGVFKMSDGGGTAALALLLNEVCSTTAVYTTYDSPSDPNYHDDNDFKRAIASLAGEKKIVLLLDLHGSSPLRPYEVDLGTMGGKSVSDDQNLVPDLARAFQEYGVIGLSLDRFSGSKNATIIKFAAAMNIPAVQLEVSATRVAPEVSDLYAHRFAQVAEALIKFLASRGLCISVSQK